jgi:hypothetical protein
MTYNARTIKRRTPLNALHKKIGIATRYGEDFEKRARQYGLVARKRLFAIRVDDLPRYQVMETQI